MLYFHDFELNLKLNPNFLCPTPFYKKIDWRPQFWDLENQEPCLIHISSAVFLNRCAATHKCAVSFFQVCRHSWILLFLSKNKNILVGICNTKLCFLNFQMQVCRQIYFWCLVCRELKKVENHCSSTSLNWFMDTINQY
jgi:hypothetical protein